MFCTNLRQAHLPEIGILLPNNQRQHLTSHIQKDAPANRTTRVASAANKVWTPSACPPQFVRSHPRRTRASRRPAGAPATRTGGGKRFIKPQTRPLHASEGDSTGQQGHLPLDTSAANKVRNPPRLAPASRRTCQPNHTRRLSCEHSVDPPRRTRSREECRGTVRRLSSEQGVDPERLPSTACSQHTLKIL